MKNKILFTDLSFSKVQSIYILYFVLFFHIHLVLCDVVIYYTFLEF